MKKGTLKKWMIALCAMILSISLFAIPAFAEETANDGDKPFPTALVVWLSILAVVLVVAVVLCIKFREKIKKFFRVYKSESKKIVWLPWDQTRKSTWVVLVLLVAFTAVICLLDWGLSTGISELILAFKPAA